MRLSSVDCTAQTHKSQDMGSGLQLRVHDKNSKPKHMLRVSQEPSL